MNHPIIVKVARRLMPTVIICFFFAFFDRINARFAEFQLRDPLTFSDPACRLGASLALLLGAGAILFLLPPGPRAKEGAA